METSGLASFLIEEYFSNWKNNRKSMFEDKWTRNMEAFERISSDFWKAEETDGWRSDTFIGLTKQKVLSAWSIIIDSYLQENKLPFNLKPSPVDNIYLEDLPREERAIIVEEIEDMARHIRQQMKDCKAPLEIMKCVMSGAVYGEAYAKRYIEEFSRPYYQLTNYGRYVRTVSMVTQPGWEYVSCWNIFRDYEVDSIEDCAGICQVDYVSPFILRQSIGLPGYLESAITEVIEEYASRQGGGNVESSRGTGQDYDPDWAAPPESAHQKMTRYTSVIPRREFWARVPREAAEEFEADVNNDDFFYTDTGYQNDGDEVEIMVQMADDKIVRYARVSREERPFYWTPWEIKLDFPGGCGVADNVEDSQKVLNGLVRAFEDNKKLSGNVILAAKESFFQKMGNTITPGMKIKVSEEIDDAQKALQSIVIPDVGDSLLSGIGLFERYADEESQLPKILQGAQHEKQKADTAFELNQLQTNAGKYIGGVIKNFDENLIEPIITDFYEYNMDDPDIQIPKRNLIVEATGFSSYQNRVLRLNKLLQLLNLIMSHEATIAEADIRDLIREISIALTVDPSIALKRMDEKKAEEEAAQAERERLRAIEDKGIELANDKTVSETGYNDARRTKELSEADENRSSIRIAEAEEAARIVEGRKPDDEKESNDRKLKAV